MSMASFPAVVFCSLLIFALKSAVLVVDSFDFDACNANGTDKIENKFPTKYRVTIEAVVNNITDKKDITYAINEFRNGEKDKNAASAVYQKDDKENLQIWLFRSDSNSFINKTDCKTKNGTTTDIVGTPMLIDLKLFDQSNPIVSFSDLWARLTNTSAKIKKLNNDTSNDTSFDFPVDRFVGCLMVKDNVTLRYNIAVSNVSLPGLDEKYAVPLLVELGTYKSQNDSITKPQQRYTFRLSSYASTLSRADEEKLLPPNGVHCDGFSADKSKKFPNISAAFSVRTEYMDFETGKADYLQSYTDNLQHLFAYEYTRNLTDRPLSYGLTLKDGHYRILHDFNTGLQYIVDITKGLCYSVTSLPNTTADVEISNINATANKTLSIKDALNSIFVTENLTWSYIGQRSSINSLMDVWTAQSNAGNETVYEIWMYSANWTLGRSSAQNMPAMLRVYRGTGDKRKLSTQQRFFDYILYEDMKTPLPWELLNFRSCLSVAKNESYLWVQLKSEKDLDQVDFEQIKHQVIFGISKHAGVSWFRLADFYYQPTSQYTMNVIFVLANRSEANGTDTEWFKQESDVKTAREKLNASLTADDLKFEVDGTKLALVKNSLALVPRNFAGGNGTFPPFPPPEPTKHGYTGGSLAAMGIFMFIFGSVAGFALAFFLWKRNRGGIQYEVYQ